MANNKKKKSAKAVRLQRVRAIQGSVGVVCLFIIGFVLFWAAKSAFKTISDDSSEAVKTAPAASAAEKDDKSADDTDSKDTDSADDSAKPDSDSSAEEAAAPADSTDDSEASGADEYWNDVADSSEAEGGDTEESKEESKFPSSDEIDDDFADACFIGNSRTVGLGMNCGKPEATFYASIGLNVENLWWEGDDAAQYNLQIDLDDGTKGSVFDALEQKDFGRIYIMFGINEMGWPSWDAFEEKYTNFVNEVKKLQPDAKIYIQSILPVSSYALNNNSCFTTENVDSLNERVKNVASATGCTYLDVNSALREPDGSLPLEASTDGIHLMKDYCMIWLKYLADHT